FIDVSITLPYALSLHDALPSFRSHSRPCQHAVAKNQRRTTGHHDLAHGAAKGGHVRDHGAIESDRGIIRTECRSSAGVTLARCRSEEHTSELQSRVDLVCRLLL